MAAPMISARTVHADNVPLTPLPEPEISESAKISDILMAAERAVAAGRIGEGMSALEMAQTRMLDRSVPLFQTNTPSNDPLVGMIVRARGALEAGDRMDCAQLIESAMAEARSRGL